MTKSPPAAPPAPRRSELWETVSSLGSTLLILFVLRTFLIQPYSIPSGSMENTMLIKDYLMANSILFGPRIPFSEIRLPGMRDPRPGEIVVFRPTYNQPVMDVVKRVIGTPGDTIAMRGATLYRNGARVPEPYTLGPERPDEPIPLDASGIMLPPEVDPSRYGHRSHLPALAPGIDAAAYAPTRDNWGPLVVPQGHYFVMGDHRDESLDSRYMGFVPREVIHGKPMFIYYSYDHTLERPIPALTAIRWSRIGDIIR